MNESSGSKYTKALTRFSEARFAFFGNRHGEGALRRVSPDDGGEWFCGSDAPWDLSGKRVLALRADAADSSLAGLYLIEGGHFSKFADTRALNQNRMLAWLGPDYKNRVLYGDLQDGKPVSVVYDVDEKRTLRVLPVPVRAIAKDGKTALGTAPEAGDWQIVRVNLETSETTPILTATALRAFEEKASMRGAANQIDALSINPSGTRFLAHHCWMEGAVRHARLLTFDMDGENPFTLADEDIVSHSTWLSDDQIISFCRLGGVDGYHLLRDRTLEHAQLWSSIAGGGAVSVGANGLVTLDTAPDKSHMRSVSVIDGEEIVPLARVFAPGRYGSLHPRFDRLGMRIMLEAAFEGQRALYELPAHKAEPAPKVLTVISVPMQFDGPTLSTLRYARSMEWGSVQIDFVAIKKPPAEIRDQILGMGSKLYIAGNRTRNPIGYVLRLAHIVRRGRYQIVHAHGNSCTLTLEMLGALLGGAKVRVAHSRNSYCKYLTAHRLLRPLFDRLYTDAYACGAEAGEWLFQTHPFSVARNSVEPEIYQFDPAAREKQRQALGVGDALLIGSVANYTPAKNHPFLLEVFADYLQINPTAKLALVGGGALRPETERKIADLGIGKNVLVLGVRTDVATLLSAFDAMLLPSLWEGFPNVLVEWQCAGLRTFVSDQVTRDAKLTSLISYLPINSTASWVESLSRFVVPTDRAKVSADAISAVRAGGFDIQENARGMQNFYIEAARRCPRA